MKGTMRQYCEQADGMCANPAAYQSYSGMAVNDDRPRCSIECVYCGHFVCKNCRVKIAGRWYCNDCAEHRHGYKFNETTGMMCKPVQP